ncbi:MAG: dihydrofolate reductase family protein [Candidatus Limnocylindrales bacterium]
MAKLIYLTNVSLDSYIEDQDGTLDWSDPSDEYFAFITDLVRPVGTYLYGRRLYESMAVWETDPALAERSALLADFAEVWQGASKVVYSTSLPSVPTADTRIERHFDIDSVRALKASATSDMTIGGAALAGQAFDGGLVDECHLLVHPVILGGGKRAFAGRAHITLELLEERRLDNGVAYLRYACGRPGAGPAG